MKKSFFLKICAALILAAVLCTAAVSCKKEEPSSDPADSGDAPADTGVGGVDVGEFKDILDPKGNKIGQEIYFADGSLKYVENYNSNGDIIDSVLYNKDGTKSVEESRLYDADGKIKQYVTVKYEYENGALKQYNQSYFNEKKWCTASYGYNADGSSQGFYTYEYDDAGYEIEKREFGENMALRFIFETEYNDDNKAVKEITKDPRGNVTGFSLIEYNASGNISRRSECAPDGTVRNYCDYVYDGAGNLAEEQIFVSDGQGGFIRYN